MGTHSILIVDTDNSTADQANQALSQDGYKVQIARSSQEAINAARQVKPSLLIINAIMPLRSGVETARQIALTVGSKVLFLSELSKDADFREVLRGLKQQGIECSAMGRHFESRELVAHVRREIGPVIVLTDEEDVEPNATEASRPAMAAPARAPLPDYVPLLEFVSPQMYEKNAFRLTGLRTDTSLRNISKQAERLEMMAKLGVAQNASQPASERSASEEEIRAALQFLKNPEQRVLHEFFWFWTTTEPGEEGAAVEAIGSGDFDKSEKEWLSNAVAQTELAAVSARLNGPCTHTERISLTRMKQSLERRAAVSVHNLAVLNHFRAIAAEGKTPTPSSETERIKYWKASLQFWQKLRNQHAFWEVLVDRIRVINDPRLTIDVAERIWTTLPLALLSVNASYAITAAEASRFEDAGLQRRLMKESGLGENDVREALGRGLKPLRDELTRLCETAERESLEKPECGADIVRKLFEDKKRYLQTFNYLLGAGDPFRDAAHDLVAQSARAALVAYANKTESWETAQALFEECLALAESMSLRSRLEDDLEMLTGNAAAERAARRAQATAAPSQPSSTQQRRPAAASSTVAQSTKPKRSPWVIIAAVIIVGIIIIDANRQSEESSSTRSTSSQTVTEPAGNRSSTPSYEPDTTNAPPANPFANTAEPSATAGYSRSDPDNEAETADLRTTIENNRGTLRRMEGEMSDLDIRISTLKSQIESDKATLQQMERDHDLGFEVDLDRYEATRQRHNSAVRTFKSLINQYNAFVTDYNALLNTTKAQIGRYNALVRSR